MVDRKVSPSDPLVVDRKVSPSDPLDLKSTLASTLRGKKEDAVISMTVSQVVLDPRNQTPIVILVSEDGLLALPIWIGAYEATAIIMAMEDVELPHPMTHDLMLDVIRAMGSRIDYVVIHEVRDKNFYAEIVLEHGEEHITVDARPSDSIALALRADTPILAERAVCDDAKKIEKFLEEAQAERYKVFLDAWKPEDISHKM